MLDLPARAAAPCEKYVRDRIIGWAWNSDSDVSLVPLS